MAFWAAGDLRANNWETLRDISWVLGANILIWIDKTGQRGDMNMPFSLLSGSLITVWTICFW